MIYVGGGDWLGNHHQVSGVVQSFLISVLKVTRPQVRVLETQRVRGGAGEAAGGGQEGEEWCDAVIRVEINLALMLMRFKSELAQA